MSSPGSKLTRRDTLSVSNLLGEYLAPRKLERPDEPAPPPTTLIANELAPGRRPL